MNDITKLTYSNFQEFRELYFYRNNVTYHIDYHVIIYFSDNWRRKRFFQISTSKLNIAIFYQIRKCNGIQMNIMYD